MEAGWWNIIRTQAQDPQHTLSLVLDIDSACSLAGNSKYHPGDDKCGGFLKIQKRLAKDGQHPPACLHKVAKPSGCILSVSHKLAATSPRDHFPCHRATVSHVLHSGTIQRPRVQTCETCCRWNRSGASGWAAAISVQGSVSSPLSSSFYCFSSTPQKLFFLLPTTPSLSPNFSRYGMSLPLHHTQIVVPSANTCPASR